MAWCSHLYLRLALSAALGQQRTAPLHLLVLHRLMHRCRRRVRPSSGTASGSTCYLFISAESTWRALKFVVLYLCTRLGMYSQRPDRRWRDAVSSAQWYCSFSSVCDRCPWQRSACSVQQPSACVDAYCASCTSAAPVAAACSVSFAVSIVSASVTSSASRAPLCELRHV